MNMLGCRDEIVIEVGEVDPVLGSELRRTKLKGVKVWAT